MRTLLLFAGLFLVLRCSADPLPDGTAGLTTQWTTVHLINADVNPMYVQSSAASGPGQYDIPQGGSITVQVRATTFDNGTGVIVTTPDDGSELYYVQGDGTYTWSWTVPSHQTPTAEHYHFFWSGVGLAFAWFGGFGLVKRIVQKSVNHSAEI
jgi:hypothetical protein